MKKYNLWKPLILGVALIFLIPVLVSGQVGSPNYVKLVSGAPDYRFTPLLTVGEEVPLMQGQMGNISLTNQNYALTGKPDGLGLVQNASDGLIYVYVNHELSSSVSTQISSDVSGQINGARVSLYAFDEDWQAVGGRNLIEKVIDDATTYVLDLVSGDYMSGGLIHRFNRFCSGYLAKDGFVDLAGNPAPVYFAPEEVNDGRGWAVFPDGTALAINDMGEYKKEQIVASSAHRAGDGQTVLLVTEDAGDGELYMYVGNQTAADPNGFTDGDLYVLRVETAGGTYVSNESMSEGTTYTATWVQVPDSEVSGGAGTLSNWVNASQRSTNFQRLEDIHEDPQNEGTFYFATTGGNGTENTLGFLYELTIDQANPTGNGTIEAVLEGSASNGVSYDNLTVDHFGRVLIQEDRATTDGSNVMAADTRYARVVAYDIASDNAEYWFEADQATIDPSSATNYGGWETSGIIAPEINRTSGVSRDGHPYLMTVQAHTIPDLDYAQGGQLVLAELPNVALGKTATQSSDYYAGSVANRAVDGNTNGAWGGGSISNTQNEAQPWWEVDLGDVYDLSTIRLWSRTNCCQSRLADFHVFVSDVPFASTGLAATQAQLGVTDLYYSGTISQLDTLNINRTGRYVRVQLNATNMLHLAEAEIFGSPLPSLPNLALGKKTNQSSTYPSAVSDRAVDGNTDGNWGGGSISNTGNQAQPWWEVDLGANYDLSTIQLWSRTNCCPSRLADFHVFVSDVPFASTSLAATQAQAGVTDLYYPGTISQSDTLSINRTGRYVRVQLNATNLLHLAEVQVFGSPLPNLALGKTATQSSDYYAGSVADRAVDGNTDGNWGGGSISNTQNEAQPWWEVDLGASYDLSTIQLWSRTNCCPSRLTDFHVFVSDVPFASTGLAATQAQSGVTDLYYAGTISQSDTMDINRTGRYIRVQLNATNMLHLAEVQVFGSPLPNLALGKTATQSSTYPSAVAGRAVDGNTDGNWGGGSISNTGNEAQPWWEVDLGANYDLTTIRLWSRTNCCQSRLADFHVFVSDAPFASPSLAATQAQAGVTDLQYSGTIVQSDTMDINRTGRYVRVQLNATNMLHLAEVQIFGSLAGTLPYNQAQIRTDDLGTNKGEFSGVTLNHDNGRLLIADDNNTLHEVNLDGNLLPTGTRRNMTLNIGGDAEGVAWMYDNTYAVVSETQGKLYIIDLPDNANLTTVDSTHVIHEIDTQISAAGNTGLEGVAFDFNSASGPNEQEDAVFYVVEENPPSVYRVTWDGTRSGPVPVPTIDDTADIYATPSGSIYVSSHESRRIVQLDIDDAFVCAEVISSQLLSSRYLQADGLTFSEDESTMLVVSENGRDNVNYSFGRFTAPPAVMLPLDSVEIRSDNLGASTNEFSGVTYNLDTGRMLIVDDEDVLHEFDLDNNLSPTFRRTMDINVGSDIEGIAWMYDDTYAIAAEDTRLLYIVDLSDAQNQTHVNSAFKTIDTGIQEDSNGYGLEGVAFDFNSASDAGDQENAVFYVARQSPPEIYRVEWDGTRTSPVSVPSVSVVSDIYASPDGSIYVVSSPRTVLQLEVNDAFSSAAVVSSQTLPSTFLQSEGITFSSDLSTMIIVSEQGGNGTNSGFGRFGGYPLLGDVTCNGVIDANDTQAISGYEVGNRTGVLGCPLSNPSSQMNLLACDVNGDGSCNVVDGLFVQQCSQGISNNFCP